MGPKHNLCICTMFITNLKFTAKCICIHSMAISFFEWCAPVEKCKRLQKGLKFLSEIKMSFLQYNVKANLTIYICTHNTVSAFRHKLHHRYFKSSF